MADLTQVKLPSSRFKKSRIAVWGTPADRDFFIGTEIRSSMFCGISDQEIVSTHNPRNRNNWQEVGFAAAFMS